MLGVAGAFADPGDYRRDAREAVRAYHIQSIILERNLPRDSQQGMLPPERPRQGTDEPESSGYGSAGETQSNYQQADKQRRPGRMTPEERRALRRQIDEVGHDIYSGKQ